ncbi:MAG: META domain-containing protein [Coriobacteriia bacterium]|nr:META domain-containing protein [Coriobacteriia bacterium]
MRQRTTRLSKWLFLGVLIVLGISLLFVTGCDGKGSNSKSKDKDSEKSSNVDKNKDKNKDDTQVAPIESEIIGPEWTLIAMAPDENGSAAEPIPEKITASITFADDGMYHVQAPVNIVNGPFTVSDTGELTLGTGAMTRMAALDEEVAAAEDVFVALLARVVSYKLEGDVLSLQDSAGTTILEFKK